MLFSFRSLLEIFESSVWCFPSFPCYPCSPNLLHILQSGIAGFHEFCSPACSNEILLWGGVMMIETPCQMDFDSSSVNINQCSSYLTNICYEFLQTTIWESCLTIVIVKMSITKARNTVLKELAPRWQRISASLSLGGLKRYLAIFRLNMYVITWSSLREGVQMKKRFYMGIARLGGGSTPARLVWSFFFY